MRERREIQNVFEKVRATRDLDTNPHEVRQAQ